MKHHRSWFSDNFEAERFHVVYSLFQTFAKILIANRGEIACRVSATRESPKPLSGDTDHSLRSSLASQTLTSSPGLLRGEGEGRPGIHCMRMRCCYSDCE